jgi:hypothetical protein
MNDKDKEAFDNYMEISDFNVWQAACEYMRNKSNPLDALSLYEKLEKLKAENKKMRDVLEFYANGYAHEIDDSCNNYFENGHIRISSGKRAREALKEVVKNER